ncbi:NAD dependent epimerase/dehydratase family protein-like protein [Byssothecium circinans]|uniref:NAD dependent epimerase/dehydratase family protein-like protein n=1 Tax=Byssothecium circinans TaxID=147558 RepID=A0A6A5TX00_9PLEO|nr:NAD dependent epimerase/dehydratase family protein-like protein [Byssothecium circinans]
MSNQQVVQTRGIYHGLPVYPSSIKGLTAIITGANGISGNYMLRVLTQNPERWTKTYCLSRRPPAIPNGLPKNAEHIPLDFLKDKEEIARVLREKGVQADYVFFYSYVQAQPKEGKGLWSDAKEMCRVNVALLKNFCDALPLANIKPKRIMLQTGAKNYGIHLGPAVTPQEEHHPRVTLEPNFYYPQEDYLDNFCTKQGIQWTLAMPSYILGAVPDTAMNLIYPLGIYAAVTKHLGQRLDSSKLNAYLEEWAVLTPRPRASGLIPWIRRRLLGGGFWPKFAAWYGLEYTRPVMDESVYKHIMTTPYDPPPRGFGPPATYRMRFTLVEWARREDVGRAWDEILDKYGERIKGAKRFKDMDVERIFAFADGSLAGGTLDMSMNKCIREVLGEFSELRMLPPIE